MKLMKKLSPVALATTMALGGLAAPGIASAEMSASAAVANFYLWRGQDISAGGAHVSGSLDYAHESGAYAGIWASSEEAGTETDLYVGYAGEVGGFSYDLSVWEYLYPSDNDNPGPNDSYSDSDLSEFILGLGYADVGLTIYFGNDAGKDEFGAPNDDYEYITLDYTYGDFNFLYGTWQYDKSVGADDSHVTIAYSVTDNFTFTVSKAMKDEDTTDTYDEDMLFHISYSLPIDMK